MSWVCGFLIFHLNNSSCVLEGKLMAFFWCVYLLVCPGLSSQMSWIQYRIMYNGGHLPHYSYSLLSSSPSSSPSSPYNDHYIYQKQSSFGNKISPSVVYVVVILAVIVFISGVLHLLVRFLIKRRVFSCCSSSVSESNRNPEMTGSDAYQRQLQQLFHLHDSGLDQALIDALPVFVYKEIMGLKEPFDCAICLYEFSVKDNLRLLPSCSHAFHVDCIDTWLLSNSSCPLCRGTLHTSGLPLEKPIFDFEGTRQDDGFSSQEATRISVIDKKPAENERINSKRVFSVRLGKFKSINNAAVEGETSNSNLDARRCYSMGSYQYVVTDMDLQVAFCHGDRNTGIGSFTLVESKNGQIENSSSCDGDGEGKKINIRSKGESFSVSKIWQWTKKGKFPSSSDTPMGLPWIHTTQAFAL